MLCKIADLLIEVPEAGGMSPRCQDYLFAGEGEPDITICADKYRANRYADGMGAEMVAYMESASQFCSRLLAFDGFYLHASAVELDGRAYLFSGSSGVGKSTHTRLWQQNFGAAAQVFNDDKPALRRLGGKWFAYGTPWCGKDGINQNKKVPVAGICFLKQGQQNSIRRLSSQEALTKILSQTIHRFKNPARLALLMDHLDKLLREIPVYELTNVPEPAAARLSYETMSRGAAEAGL